MASKQPRFTRKVYEGWVLEGEDGQPCLPIVAYLYDTKRDALRLGWTGNSAARVRVTVERIDKRKKAK